MKHLKKIILLVGIFSISCLWDTDTIEMEKQDFPSVLELITGQFLRHSDEFYEWRKNDRIEKLKEHPDSLHFYDDLAVSYDKLGNHKKAISTMLLKRELGDNGYETNANLGTFYIHNGQLKEGKKYIEKAIEINPDAHFGREIYQLHLVNYILEKTNQGKFELEFPINSDRNKKTNKQALFDGNFYSFLKKENGGSLSLAETQKAVKGILGMMKFGNYKSPVLLEVLGDLLINKDRHNEGNTSARQLAALAYKKASISFSDSIISSAYNFKSSIQYMEYRSSTTIKLEDELIKGEEFFNEIRANEVKWIEEGLNPEEKFAEVYYNKPPRQIEVEPIEEADTITQTNKLLDNNNDGLKTKGNSWIYILILVGAVIIIFFIVYLKRKKSI